MDEFEKLAGEQAKQGFYASVRRQSRNWQCSLFSNNTYREPHGEGDTALEALKDAIADRIILEGVRLSPRPTFTTINV